MTKTNEFKYTSYDKANLKQCKYLIMLDNEKFINEMYDPATPDKGGFKIKDIESYIRQVKTLCRRFLSHPDPDNKDIGILKQTYKYSKSYHNKGRLYVYGFGLQNLQNKLRGFLVQDIYKDYDIVNSAPTIIYNLIKETCPNKEFPTLKKYVNLRDKVLYTYDLKKVDILIRIFSDNPSSSKNLFLLSIDKELMEIKKILWDADQFPELKDKTKKNKMGSYLSKLYHVKENEILQDAKKCLKLDVPIFDGAYIEETEKFKNDDILQILNANSHNVKFINKEIKTDITIDLDIIGDEFNIMDMSYDAIKVKFEEKHFFIKHPPVYGGTYKDENNERQVFVYKKTEFQTLVEDEIYEDYTEDGKMVKRSFFNTWSKDKEKIKYDRLDFIPNENFDNERIFNTFNGFKVNTWENKIDDKFNPEEALNSFKDHVNLLVGKEQDAYNYLINYIAHLFQKPDKRPDVALLFKSEQGVGKDTFIDILSSILGDEYLFRTADIEKVLGQFNDKVANKLIIQLNELAGVDGFGYKEKLKNIITADKINMNPKGKTPFDLKSFIRIIIFTNNFTPIDIPHDDRRYIVFKSSPKREKSYYNNIRDWMKCKNCLKHIYNYFMNIDISNFTPDERPLTDAYKEIQSNNISPVYSFLYDLFRDDEYKNIFEGEFHTHKKTGKILIQSSILYRQLKHDYLPNNGQGAYKIDFKKLKVILTAVNVNKEAKKIQGSVKDYYVINKKELLEELKKRGVEDIIEEIDDDEYE